MPPKVSEFLAANWRGVAAAILVVVAFAGGRFSVPTKVQIKTVDRVVTVDRIVATKGEDKVQTRTVYVDRTVIQRKDGTTIKRDIERTESDKSDKTRAASVETKASSAVAISEKIVERSAPSWHISALGGFGGDHPGQVIYGLQAERRILGPIWLGLWGTNIREGGVSLGVQF